MNRPRSPDLGWIKKDATLSVVVLQQVRVEVLAKQESTFGEGER